MKTAGAAIDPVNAAVSIKESVKLWLEEMGEGLSPGRFRFCKTRNFAPTDGKRGQGITCYALKSAWHIGAWDDWPSEVKDGCAEFIKAFQTPGGYFVDEWLLRRTDICVRLSMAKRRRFRRMSAGVQDAKERAVIADTRQSAATLTLIGDRPRHPLPTEWGNEGDAREYIRSLDWSEPWGAASRAGHIVALAAMNADARGGLAASDARLFDAVFEETDRFRDEKTGVWGGGGASPVQRINGAMKMLGAYDWANRPMPHPDRIIDYALGEQGGEDGCGALDKLYVLLTAGAEAPGHRAADIELFALDALADIGSYRRADGGFSFYRSRATRWYYEAIVGLGEKQSDMHGAAMLTWACAAALDLLGLREELGWRTSKP